MNKNNNGSNNGADKRKRVASNDNRQKEVIEVETLDFDLNQFKTSDEDEFLTPTGEFDWDRYEAFYNTKLKVNKKIKTGNRNHVVYCHEPYAQKMYEALNNIVFEDLVSELRVGEVEIGKIHTMSERWATVDIGYREMLYIDLSREDKDVVADVKPGSEVAVKIMSDKTSVREYALASITEGTKQKVFTELRESADKGDSAYLGTVKEMIPGGGYIVTVQGIQCFMPGSLAGINKLHDFTSIIGTKMYVVPDSFSVSKGTIVVSHRKYLQALIPGAIETLKENVDAEQIGFVTGTAKYGVFVEFNQCLTGMIHINDLSTELAEAHRNNTIKPGDEIKFKVKEIISNEKIILTQREQADVKPDNSWEEFRQQYPIPATVTGIVKSIKDYGVFISIHGSVVGMAHISEFPEGTILKDRFTKGSEIKVEVFKIDEETKKVFLKVIGG